MGIELSEMNDEHGNPIFNVTLMHPNEEQSEFYKKSVNVRSRPNLYNYKLKMTNNE